MLNFCDFIRVYVFTTNHHLKDKIDIKHKVKIQCTEVHTAHLCKLHWSVENRNCTTIHRYPIFSTRYSVMCKVYTGYHVTSEIEHSLCACMVDNPLPKARGLSLLTGAQTMLYLSHKTRK